MCGDQRFEKKFRRSFRLPYTSFRELWLMLENSDAFSRWKEGSNERQCAGCGAPTPLTGGSLKPGK